MRCSANLPSGLPTDPIEKVHAKHGPRVREYLQPMIRVWLLFSSAGLRIWRRLPPHEGPVTQAGATT